MRDAVLDRRSSPVSSVKSVFCPPFACCSSALFEPSSARACRIAPAMSTPLSAPSFSATFAVPPSAFFSAVTVLPVVVTSSATLPRPSSRSLFAASRSSGPMLTPVSGLLHARTCCCSRSPPPPRRACPGRGSPTSGSTSSRPPAALMPAATFSALMFCTWSAPTFTLPFAFSVFSGARSIGFSAAAAPPPAGAAARHPPARARRRFRRREVAVDVEPVGDDVEVDRGLRPVRHRNLRLDVRFVELQAASSAFALLLRPVGARAALHRCLAATCPGMFGPLTVTSPAMPGQQHLLASRLSVTGVPSLPCTARSPDFASRSTSKRANWICLPFASSAESASFASTVCPGFDELHRAADRLALGAVRRELQLRDRELRVEPVLRLGRELDADRSMRFAAGRRSSGLALQRARRARRRPARRRSPSGRGTTGDRAACEVEHGSRVEGSTCSATCGCLPSTFAASSSLPGTPLAMRPVSRSTSESRTSVPSRLVAPADVRRFAARCRRCRSRAAGRPAPRPSSPASSGLASAPRRSSKLVRPSLYRTRSTASPVSVDLVDDHLLREERQQRDRHARLVDPSRRSPCPSAPTARPSRPRRRSAERSVSPILPSIVSVRPVLCFTRSTICGLYWLGSNVAANDRDDDDEEDEQPAGRCRRIHFSAFMIWNRHACRPSLVRDAVGHVRRRRRLAAPTSTWPRWSSKKMSAPNAFRNGPLSRPPRNSASSMRMSHARSVRTTRSCAGALRAVTSAVRIGARSGGVLRLDAVQRREEVLERPARQRLLGRARPRTR